MKSILWALQKNDNHKKMTIS